MRGDSDDLGAIVEGQSDTLITPHLAGECLRTLAVIPARDASTGGLDFPAPADSQEATTRPRG